MIWSAHNRQNYITNNLIKYVHQTLNIQDHVRRIKAENMITHIKSVSYLEGITIIIQPQ